MRKVKWLSGFLLAVLLVTGCGKKEESPTGPGNEPVVPQIVAVHGPNSQNVPPMVASTVNMMNVLGSMGQSFVAAVQGLDPTHTGDAYVWSYTVDAARYTVTATGSSEGVNWHVKVSGTYENHQVSDFVLVRGFSAADGKSGWWEGYDVDSGQRSVRYEWSTDSQGAVHAILTIYEDPVVKFEVVNNPDGSGSLVHYEGNIRRMEVTWQANGAGSYTMYDDNGNVTAQGNWT